MITPSSLPRVLISSSTWSHFIVLGRCFRWECITAWHLSSLICNFLELHLLLTSSPIVVTAATARAGMSCRPHTVTSSAKTTKPPPTTVSLSPFNMNLAKTWLGQKRVGYGCPLKPVSVNKDLPKPISMDIHTQPVLVVP